MSKFRIGINEEVGGYVTIEAKSEAAAKKKVMAAVEHHGFDHLSDVEYDVEITYRDAIFV